MKTPPITPRQQEIYDCWLANNHLYKPTARAMGTQPEKVRQAVAAVLYKLKQPPPEPKTCEYCAGILGARNQSGYCSQCYEKSPQRRKRMFLNKANKNVRWWDFYDASDRSGCRAAVCSLPEGYSGDLPVFLIGLLKAAAEG
jgi:hypothetical protein